MNRPDIDPGCTKCGGCYGSRACDCSRESTRQLALWIWERVCAGLRRVKPYEWVCIAFALAAVATSVWGR